MGFVMENTVSESNIQIVLSGEFQPFAANPDNILEMSVLLNKFKLFPKEVLEQKIEFSQNMQQSITITKSLELVSINQQSILQVRSDMLVYNYNSHSDSSLKEIFMGFIDILKEIQLKINFNKAFRLGLIQTKREINANIENYKQDNKLSKDIIEHRNRTVVRQPLENISEIVNVVKENEFISREAGAPQDILSYTVDINTLSDKDAARFSIENIHNFLEGVSAILKE